MKIVILGAGIIGVSAAYALARRGHSVTVLDRRAGPGMETSFANGALLTPSMADPWNSPGCWKMLLGSLGRDDAALQLRLKALPSLAHWGLSFLSNARPAAFERNRLSNLRLALYSMTVMAQWRAATGILYRRSDRGTLRLFRNHRALEEALQAAATLASEGLEPRYLTRSEVVEFEPSLASQGSLIAGAIHYPQDETGDAHLFCGAIAQKAKAEGVTFLFNQQVSRLRLERGGLAPLDLGTQHLSADRYVVAAGSYSTPLLSSLGLDLPITPAKGYSLTVVDGVSHCALRTPLVDDSFHAVVVPLGNDLRVAGTAEFAGFDLSLRQARVENLAGILRQMIPSLPLDAMRVQPWCGLRPMSSDGVPIVGATPLPNVYVSCGHGHLGWTMAAGSAELLADLINDAEPAVDAGAYALARFGQKQKSQIT